MKTSLILGTAIGALMMTAAAGANAQSWADNTTVSGRIYADVTDLSVKTNDVKQPASGFGTDVKRFYIGIDHKFDNIWAVNVTTDFTTVNTNSGNLDSVYIKKAYVEGKFSPALDVRIGSTDMPWIPYAEGIYGYRYIENTLSDKAHVGTSADWGVHANGKLGPIFSYAISAVNGNGYKNTARAKSVDVEGRLSAKLPQWDFAIGGYTGKLGTVYGVATPNTANRFNAIGAWHNDVARVGVEYFSANDYSAAIIKGAPEDKADGWSVFGNYQLNPVYGLVARYDDVKPNKTTVSSREDKYYNVGVTYAAFKNVSFALMLKHDELSSTGVKTVTDEVGIWSQMQY
ncbi:porin [Asticcacaulis sp. EMRT-3]|uniref:porin n=1 Tax=Asticcacaulis sp. EMRT-3 TaxID=3040349 RepID=UPI0024AF3CE7|nr:porin [Asticcacaulis sp. EMRT-3]MDI7776095.1 porin [Asticcacaulis sp. EMRT-3]